MSADMSAETRGAGKSDEPNRRPRPDAPNGVSALATASISRPDGLIYVEGTDAIAAQLGIIDDRVALLPYAVDPKARIGAEEVVIPLGSSARSLPACRAICRE